jgi:hypothetical protein
MPKIIVLISGHNFEYVTDSIAAYTLDKKNAPLCHCKIVAFLYIKISSIYVASGETDVLSRRTDLV